MYTRVYLKSSTTMSSPLISVIVPIYNIENYLSAALDSVLKQTVGFENSIQLILVDDGSSDSSLKVAQGYADSYPDNTMVISQPNSGVSAARNNGLRKAEGEFIHFFDGDDILSSNFYEKNIAFLSKNKQVPFAASKLKFFDEIIDPHPLNYKFDKTRVINLETEPDNPVMHVISCVFRRNAIEGALFDESLSIAEDVKFISDILLQSRQYGVLHDTTYHYRKRSDGTSAIAKRLSNPDNYLPVVNRVYKHMFDTWGKSSEAIEYTILYDIAYRLNQPTQGILSEADERLYKESLKSILARCHESTIATCRHLNIHQKLYALQQRHGESYQNQLKLRDGALYFGEYHLYDYRNTPLYLDFVTRKNEDIYLIEGYANSPDAVQGVIFYASVNGVRSALKPVERFQLQESFLGDIYKSGGAFEVELSIPVASEISFVADVNGLEINLPFQTGPYTRFGALRWTYRRDNDRLMKRMAGGIKVIPYTLMSHVGLEVRMWLQILLNWRLSTVRERVRLLRERNLSHLSTKAKLIELAKPFAFSVEAIFYIPRALILRAGYYIAKRYKRRPIWIVSDRPMAAGDNGEALFKYAIKQPDSEGTEILFALSKKSADYERMRGIGPVINTDTLRFKLKFLLADKVISSQADIETTNPFLRQRDHYGDLFEFEFVFLQHGIIRHDHTAWLSRFDRNINLFITSAQKEYDSILDYPYYYDSSQVILSGLPRYDYLTSAPAGKLILAPTYRKSLVREKTDRLGRRGYDSQFKGTYYREFYNRLINDERLLDVMRDSGMKGEFYLHQVFSAQREDFESNDVFKMMEFPYDYPKAFREGSLLVSDYSSVMFDFAYLKKPVVYAHFDVDAFFAGHSYSKSDFFSDEEDGFGDVCYDYESLVDAIIKTIENGCRMEQKYQQRVDSFFYRVDTSNSKRVYDAIISTDRSNT